MATDEEHINFWFIDETENAIDNLDMLAVAMSQPASIKWWKWAIIAAHQALYSFALMALSGTSPIYTIAEQNIAAKVYRLRAHEGKSVAEIAKELNISTIKVNKALRNGPRVIPIRKALIRLQLPKEKHCLPWSNSQPLKMSRVERKAIRRLVNEFRNSFEHFYPTSWSIEPSVLQEILPPVLRVIRFIATESNCILYHQEGQFERVLNTLNTIEENLGNKAELQDKHFER